MNAITKQLAESLDKYYEADDSKYEVYDPRFNRASAAGWLRDCKRHLVLARLKPEAYVITAEQKDRFREGRKQERLMREDLVAAGVKITTKKMGKSFTLPDIETKGEIDDELQGVGTVKDLFTEKETEEKAVIDYKSASKIMFHELKKYSDGSELRHSTFPWIRHYPDQQLLYLVANRIPLGILFFKNKESGERHFVEITWNSGEFHLLTDGLMEINECVKHENVPPIADDPSVCKYCGFQGFCFPESEIPGAPKAIDSQDLMILLTRRQELIDAGIQKAASELEKINDEIKDMARLMPGKISVGDFVITMEPGSGRVFYDLDDEAKAKYKRIAPNWKPIRIKFLGGAL